MASAISTTDLTKHYPGVRALEGLTIDVPQGSIYGFLGANGAGKTTALKILAGLTRPTSGSATVAGIPLAAGRVVQAGDRLPRPGAPLLRLDDGARRRCATSPASTPGCRIRSSAGSTRPST